VPFIIEANSVGCVDKDVSRNYDTMLVKASCYMKHEALVVSSALSVEGRRISKPVRNANSEAVILLVTDPYRFVAFRRNKNPPLE
jgi:hypothetical protein